MTTKVFFSSVETLQELKKEYKKLVAKLHPDKHGNTEESNNLFASMQKEYETKKAIFEGGNTGDVSKVTHNFTAQTTTFNGKVYDYSDTAKESVKDSVAAIKVDYQVYMRTLEHTLSQIEVLYTKHSDDYSVTENIDHLCKLCHVSPSDFWDMSFIKSCYIKHSFALVDGGQLDNVMCEKRKVSDKTDFAKLEERCAKYGLPVSIIPFIEKSKTANGKDKECYYMPVTNFSISNVLKHLLENTYKVKMAAYNRAKSTAAKKAKQKARKEAQKAKKAA